MIGLYLQLQREEVIDTNIPGPFIGKEGSATPDITTVKKIVLKSLETISNENIHLV